MSVRPIGCYDVAFLIAVTTSLTMLTALINDLEVAGYFFRASSGFLGLGLALTRVSYRFAVLQPSLLFILFSLLGPQEDHTVAWWAFTIAALTDPFSWTVSLLAAALGATVHIVSFNAVVPLRAVRKQ